MVPSLQALRRRLWPDSLFETDFESQRVQRERATGVTAHILESELDRLALLLSEVMTELVHKIGRSAIRNAGFPVRRVVPVGLRVERRRGVEVELALHERLVVVGDLRLEPVVRVEVPDER